MNDISNNAFVNMDKTAVYFDSHSNYTVNEKDAKIMPVLRERSANKCYTVCISVKSDVTKQSLFFIFKIAVSGPIANSLQKILPTSIHSCKDPKGWIDNRVMEIR